MEENVIFAFFLTLIAGLSTGIGSFIAFFAKKRKPGFLSFGLGFSAGVMIYISMVELIPHAEGMIKRSLEESDARWISVGSFFLGIAISFLIDKFIPEHDNPHHLREEKDISKLKTEGVKSKEPSSSSLAKAGIFTAIAIAIHNLPEGMAAFMGALANPTLGISIAIAIMIHNIPEGISVSVPIYYATGNRKKALVYSFLSGLAEPAGAIIGYLILRPFLDDTIMGIAFGTIAGIMVYISFDELFPAAREYGKGHTAIFGLVLGMAVMAVTLLLAHHAH